MNLEAKPDFDKVLSRFEAWWQCELVDRPLVTMHVRSGHSPKMPRREHATQRDRWMDIEHTVDCLEASLELSVYVAERFPMLNVNLGPEICATAFGCDLEFSDRTAWSKPVCDNIRQVLDIKPTLDNPYWNRMRELTELSLARGKGKWLTGITDLHTNGDLLASLRDPQNLCMDCADDLEGVALACEHVTRFYGLMYDDLWNRLVAGGQKMFTTWTPCLHAGKAYITNCDFICMISPEMFRRAILPSIVREMEFLERNIFHLDGPGALRHLDALLEQPLLNGVQFVWGAGNGPARKWMHVYKRIQQAGKCVQILADEIEDVRACREELKPQGVWFTMGNSWSLDQAHAVIRMLEDWAGGKR
jgi:hypothetical protein